MFGMQSNKAPSPDGQPPLFYKTYWDIVGGAVSKAVQSFYRKGHLLKEMNNTFNVLIPKTSNLSSINQFPPISLCNSVYKVISKILVSRLRPLLANLISLCQSAFVPGRWIAENHVIVQELFHSFKKRKVKGGFVAMKIDLQKAYDRVSCDFFRIVLRNFGFCPTFIN